jgi:hypothetical protein
MFPLGRFTSHAYFIQHEMTDYYISRVSPFGHLRIKARLPLPEAYRSYATSFIASYRQGIHL